MSFHQDEFHQYIDSSYEEKKAILRILRKTDEELINAYDNFASPNEKIFDFVRNEIEKLQVKMATKKWTSP